MLGLFTTKAYAEPVEPDAAAAPQAAPDPAPRGPDRGLARLQGRGLAVRLVPEGRAVRRLDRRPARRRRRAAGAPGRAGAAARPPRPRRAQRLADRRAAALALRRASCSSALHRRTSASASAPTPSTRTRARRGRARADPLHACTPPPACPTSTSASSRARSSRSPARGTTSCASALVERHGRGPAAARWPRSGAPRFPRYYKASAQPGARGRTTSAASCACETLGEPFVVGLQNETDQSGERTRVGALQGGRQGRAGRRDADARGPRPARDRGGPDAAARRRRRDLGAGLRRARARRPAARPRRATAPASPTASPRSGAATPSRTRSTGSCSSAGLDWRQIEILRAYRKYRQRIGSRFTESYQNDVLAANRGADREARAPVRAALRPRARARRGGRGDAARGDPRRPRRGRVARPRPHPAQPARADRGDAAHQRLPPRARRDGVQAALRRRPGDPAARAAVRDLRLLGRRWRASTCAAAGSRAAASAGRTARTTAPRSSG